MFIKEHLLQEITQKTAKVVILGLGYVGLPLAVVFAEAGFCVIGVDSVQENVDAVNRGESCILHVPQNRQEGLTFSWKPSIAGFVFANLLSSIDGFLTCQNFYPLISIEWLLPLAVDEYESGRITRAVA